MKTATNTTNGRHQPTGTAQRLVAACLVAIAGTVSVQAAESTGTPDREEGAALMEGTGEVGGPTGPTVRSIHAIPPEDVMLGQPLVGTRESTWLGVAAEEAPDVVTAQLKLDPGVGLVVTFVAENSPAAAAGLQRNDLLVGFEDQSLVLPAQLRKLVQSREAGDTVNLTLYRNGEKQQLEVTLSKRQPGPWGEMEGWKEHLHGLGDQWRDVDWTRVLQEPLEDMRHSLKDLKAHEHEIQREFQRAVEEARRAANDPEVRAEVRRAMEEARRAMQQAMGSMSAIPVPVPPGPHPGHAPNVTVRSSGSSSQSMVRTDETGSYVLVRNPTLRLTAHDRDGNLLFDGEIETEEERATLPPELWEKVEPLVDKMSAPDHSGPVKPLPPMLPEPAPAPRPGTI